MHAALSLMLLCAGAADTVVVCPEEFRPALAPWLAHRAEQGHRCTVVSDITSPELIRAAIRRVAKQGELRFVVLVGDAAPVGAEAAEVPPSGVPTYKAKAKINLRWGSEPEIATDNWYADLDDDDVPDLAIGRLTADSKEELSLIVEKILAYERTDDNGPWRRRINLVAAAGRFGPLVDAAVETVTKKFLTDGIPPGYATTVTYGSWPSPYCPDPRNFHRISLGRLNEGCLFWVYVGDARRRGLDQVRVPGARYPILNVDDISKLHCERGLPVAIFLACYAGSYDGPRDCLAEEMLRTAGAPVAVIAGSRVTMPYAMAVFCNGMLAEFFVGRRKTLGEVILFAKRRMVGPDAANANRRLLDMLALAINPARDELAAERAEHLLLFNLIGDPLLRLRQPRTVRLDVPPQVTAGGDLTIHGTSDVPGTCTVEFVVRRDRLTFDHRPRPVYQPTDKVLRAYQHVYDRANDPRLLSERVPINGGRFRTRMRVPAEARGLYHVRVFVRGERQFAIGAAHVMVRPPPQDSVAGGK